MRKKCVPLLYVQSLKLRRIALALNGSARKVETQKKNNIFKEFMETQLSWVNVNHILRVSLQTIVGNF